MLAFNLRPLAYFWNSYVSNLFWNCLARNTALFCSHIGIISHCSLLLSTLFRSTLERLRMASLRLLSSIEPFVQDHCSLYLGLESLDLVLIPFLFASSTFSCLDRTRPHSRTWLLSALDLTWVVLMLLRKSVSPVNTSSQRNVRLPRRAIL